MGGRGASSSQGSGRGGSSVIGSGKSIEVSSVGTSHSGYDRKSWDKNIYEAKAVTGKKGILEIGYTSKMNTSYEKLSSNRTKATTTLKAGIVQSKGKFETHNINWNNVKEVTGKTYDIKDFLKEKGFKWNSNSKSWTKS